jgi:hypothetical protein
MVKKYGECVAVSTANLWLKTYKAFENVSEKLVSWSGLCPSIHQSGNSPYMGRMKDGNKKVSLYEWTLRSLARH